MGPGFLDCLFQNRRSFREFTSNIDVSGLGIEGEAGDQDALEELMRIFVNDVAILERSWFGLVCVTDQIDRPFLVGLDEAPFNTAGKTGTAPSAQPGSFNFVYNVGALHLDRLPEFLVTAVTEVAVDIRGPIVPPDVLEDQTMLEGMRGIDLPCRWGAGKNCRALRWPDI